LQEDRLKRKDRMSDPSNTDAEKFSADGDAVSPSSAGAVSTDDHTTNSNGSKAAATDDKNASESSNASDKTNGVAHHKSAAHDSKASESGADANGSVGMAISVDSSHATPSDAFSTPVKAGSTGDHQESPFAAVRAVPGLADIFGAPESGSSSSLAVPATHHRDSSVEIAPVDGSPLAQERRDSVDELTSVTSDGSPEKAHSEEPKTDDAAADGEKVPQVDTSEQAAAAVPAAAGLEVPPATGSPGGGQGRGRPVKRSPAASILSFLTPEGVDAVDAHTVRFTVAKPVVDLPTAISSKFSGIVAENTSSEDLAAKGLNTTVADARFAKPLDTDLAGCVELLLGD